MPFQINVTGSRRGIFNAITTYAGDKGHHGHGKDGRPAGKWYEEWMNSYPTDKQNPDNYSGHFTVATLGELQQILTVLMPEGKIREETYIDSIELWNGVRKNGIEAWALLNRDESEDGGEIDFKANKQQKIIKAAQEAQDILRQALEAKS